MAAAGTNVAPNYTAIIPSTGQGQGQVVSLASMMQFRVVDAGGEMIGTVSDYVVNICEAHILYAVVTPMLR